MDENKNNFNKSKMDWKPIIIFYAKTTSWIIFPLILAVLASNYLNKSGNQTVFLVFLMIGFGVTCSGVYKEIKQYKKTLKDK